MKFPRPGQCPGNMFNKSRSEATSTRNAENPSLLRKLDLSPLSWPVGVLKKRQKNPHRATFYISGEPRQYLNNDNRKHIKYYNI